MKFYLALVVCCMNVASFKSFVSSMNSSQFHLMPCVEDHDCHDFRLICVKHNHTCGCTEFYDWNESHKECVLNTNSLRDWLGQLSVADDSGDASVSEIEMMFWVQAFAGIMAITILVVLSIACFIAFCICNKERHDDRSPILGD